MAPLPLQPRPNEPITIDRRSLLVGAGAGAALLAIGQVASAPRAWASAPPSGLFSLGVASGDADAESVVLWTRLAPDPLSGGGMGTAPVEVQWRVASDPAMRRVVQHGSEVGRDYWYQFRARGELSAIGHTRLLPGPSTRPRRLSFAVANCQDFQGGYWPPPTRRTYEHMPLRPTSRPVGPSMQLYRGFRFGRLAEVSLLDTRQYRTDQPGAFPNDFGPVAVGVGNVGGTLTGQVQEAWLAGYLRATVTPDEWRTDFRTSASIAMRDAPVTTSASWVVRNGTAGAVPL
jgi:phosphodiesterase/alkaline phosphatase D-like protein